ncbi:MAG TPA: hypothetical protein VGP93_10075, partial [Polyangiaceae bacterium]|nr:hypothetical protein [Polyangiaceae bacterium]
SVIGDMGQEVIIILHSSRPEKELQQLAAGCGAKGVIPKSHDLESFLRQFERIVRASTPKVANGRSSSA